jgi:hypothetical protein
VIRQSCYLQHLFVAASSVAPLKRLEMITYVDGSILAEAAAVSAERELMNNSRLRRSQFASLLLHGSHLRVASKQDVVLPEVQKSTISDTILVYCLAPPSDP